LSIPLFHTNDRILPTAGYISKRNISKSKREEGKGGLFIILKGGFYDLMAVESCPNMDKPQS